jgi:hypothetical protein
MVAELHTNTHACIDTSYPAKNPVPDRHNGCTTPYFTSDSRLVYAPITLMKEVTDTVVA